MAFGTPRQPGRRGGFRWWPILLFGVFFLWYYTSHREQNPVTGRTQLIDLSREQEAALGLQSYEEVLSQSRVVQSGPELDLVRQIGQRIAAVTDDPGFEWEFNLIDSEQANAFCLPGGKVAVYTGILPVTQNADGLAAVMGHEIAHAVARHGAERIAHQKLAQLGQLAVGLSMSEMDVQTQRMIMGAFGLGAQYGIMLPFSREHESEADYMGLLYAAKACFDPQESVHLWERMAQSGGGPTPSEWASTHPAHETRIANLQQWMPEAQRAQAESCASAPRP